jgi:hypothetical protein
MGRVRIAAMGAILALLVIPTGVLALVGGTLDVDVEPGAGNHLSDSTLTQTFTAGLTGQLTEVELYCMTDTGTLGTVTLSVDAADSSGGQCSGDAMGWVAFTFASPLNVTAGQQYTITFECITPTHWGTAAAPYSGGSAAEGGEPIADDMAFRTYVLTATPPPTSTVVGHAPAAGSALWLLSALLAFALGSLAVIRRTVPAKKR